MAFTPLASIGFNYNRLTRDVSLVTVPKDFIDDYNIHLAHGAKFEPGSTDISGYVNGLDASTGTSVAVNIPGDGLNITAKEMIRRDRNKASVILWSLSNETPNNATRTKFSPTSQTKHEARFNSSHHIRSPRAPRKRYADDQPDPLTKVFDVIPIIMSEFGAEAKYGNHGGTNQRWTEEPQAHGVRNQFTTLRIYP